MFVVAQVIASDCDFTWYFFACCVAAKAIAFYYVVLHLVSHLLTIVWVSWGASVTSPHTEVGFRDMHNTDSNLVQGELELNLSITRR